MYEIDFYEDKDGNSEIRDYLKELKLKGSKDSKINSNKIWESIELLAKNGTYIGYPYVRHIKEKIWELRPLRNRIFFAAWCSGRFVLLHSFIKKGQKTPEKEIKKAEKELNDWLERMTK